MDIATSILDITPRGPVYLAGSPVRKYTSAVAEPLEANILAIRQDATESPIIIISTDLLYPGRILRSAIEQTFAEIPPENIFLASSHTHRAPMTDDTKPKLGSVELEYLEGLIQKFSALTLGGPLMRWGKGRLFSGSSTANSAINRRLLKRVVVSRHPKRNTFVNAPNRAGFKDETVRILIARDSSGRAIFALWNYACHPVGFPRDDQIAAHYPAAVRNHLREMFDNPKLSVVFLQGFSGNIRPSASARLNGLSRRLRRLVVGPVFSDMSLVNYGKWVQGLSSSAEDAANAAAPLPVRSIASSRFEVDATKFVWGAAESRVTFQSITFHDGFRIVGASAEVVAEYTPIVHDLAGTSNVMTVGCIDHTFGYAPTRAIYEEGGYEAGDFCDAFGLLGVNPDIENEMIAGFAAVLQ